MRNASVYRELFFSTLKISACTFGGGYVIVPLMRKRFVEELHWIGEREMLDLIAVSQSAPGPIAVNASLMIGYRMGGISGALVTAVGAVLPPLLIISLVSLFYRQFRGDARVINAMRGMRAGIAAVLCGVVLDMGNAVRKEQGAAALLLMAGAFAAVRLWHVNALLVMLACALIGAGNRAARKLTARFHRKSLPQRGV